MNRRIFAMTQAIFILCVATASLTQHQGVAWGAFDLVVILLAAYVIARSLA